ncbi:MAG: signal transduction histidine kinase [Planctomycetaceae bacterium]|jgi:signal transduction histidine kinase
MFRVNPTETSKAYRLAIVSLLALSAAAFAVTVWVMVDFLHEQEIVHGLISQLPPEAAPAAKELEGELRWQFRLSILVVLNLVVTAFAVVLLARANRATQESLRDIKAQAGDILGSMDLAVITTDLSGVVTSINRRGIEMLALDGEYVGRPLSDLSESILLEEFRQATQLNNDGSVTRDYSHSVKGSIRILRAFCQPLKNHEAEEIGNILQLRDVTERALMDDRLLRMERYMGLGSLAAGLQHEIKNPLAALSLHVQLLEEEIASSATTDEAQEMLSVIRTEVARIGGVLENFRDFASLGRLNLATVDLAGLIDRQVRLIGPQTNLQKIDIRVELPDEPLPSLQGDRVRLEQVLLNLLVNAMEAMPEGGTLTVRVETSRANDADTLRVEVLDTGPGITDAVRSRIFDPYFTTKNDGTGMGLALCDKIIRQHNGRIEIGSSQNGAVFEIILPTTDERSDEGQEP